MLRVLLLSGFASIVFAQTDRDFSGRWYFKPEKSDLQSLPEAPEAIMKIEQHSAVIHEFRITGAGGYSAEEIRTYSTDGHDTTRNFGDVTMSSQTKWEGAALLINTIVRTPNDSYTVAEHWRLSKDGTRLTIVRQIIRAHSDTESTIIYENAPQLVPRPTLVTTAAPVATPTPTAVLTPEVTAPAPALPQADFVVAQGTKLPLRLINSIDTKHSAPGDRVYLETVYPILSHGHVVIPPGSYVMGSLTEVQQAGRVKGKSSFFLRLDSITLPNGTTRDFRARMSGMDGDGHGSLDRKEGTVVGESARVRTRGPLERRRRLERA